MLVVIVLVRGHHVLGKGLVTVDRALIVLGVVQEEVTLGPLNGKDPGVHVLLIVGLDIEHAFGRADGKHVLVFVFGGDMHDAVDLMQIDDAQKLIFLPYLFGK